MRIEVRFWSTNIQAVCLSFPLHHQSTIVARGDHLAHGWSLSFL